MGATSVTGVGPGDSNGLWKRENNSGCCGKTIETTTTSTVVKKGCSIKYGKCCNNKIKSCGTLKINC